MNRKNLIVKRYIDEMDFHALLSTGAPEDEFDTESQEISEKIGDIYTEQEIAHVIASVFNRAFDSKVSEDFFIDCAKKIYADLHNKDTYNEYM